MLNDIKHMENLMKHQKEATRMYGHLSEYERLLLKRSINTSFYIFECIDELTFEELELGMYMQIIDKELLQFVRLYEFQLEEAKLHREKFIKGLHGFYMATAKMIVEQNTRNFFDFIDFAMRKAREKRKSGYRSVFDAYLSLLMQQCVYIGYIKGYEEKACCGITSDNELLFRDDLYPYSDCASYVFEDLMYKAIKQGKTIDISLVRKAYKKYGYTVNSLDDVELLDATARVFDNNTIALLTYMNENTQQILPTKAYKHAECIFPRLWQDTQLYVDALSTRRKYVLPSDGITALYFNAGTINKIIYQEIYKQDKVILLYKVCSDVNGEFSGYYDTATKDFYSIYEDTAQHEYHEQLKNFILENYYWLTCKNNIDNKRLSVLKQVEDINHIDSYCLRQPVVSFLYQKNESKSDKNVSGLRHYDRDKYKSEKVSMNGFIRKLPVGQVASSDAKQFAASKGYELEDDETFVRPFQKYVIKIKEV